MLSPIKSAAATVKVAQTQLMGGLDLTSPAGLAKPGTCRFAINYEAEFGGGYSRIFGFERFDGRASPSKSAYVVLEADDGFTSLTVGVIVTGETSLAEGKVIYISPDFKQIGLTRLLDGFTFEDDENVMLGAFPVGLITNASPNIDGFFDNDMAYLAGEEYRTPILQPPGDGPIRGVAVLGNQVYCWRDDGAYKKIYKASPTGWLLVDLGYLILFSAGTTEYLDGGTLVQGGVGAVIRRVVVTTGDWSTSDAEGYFVIGDPIGGAFTGGAAVGTGACTLGGPELPIELVSGGRVSTVAYNFFGTAATRRLYGCDGVNKEFEFDGTVYVPIETGMPAGIRAEHAACHKNHLAFAFESSLQLSGVGEPYKWLPLFGASELTTGDPITNFIAVPGSEVDAALMVTCRDSVFVLYGSSEADWRLVRVSDGFGAQAYSAQPIFGTLVFDREGFIGYSPTNAFGNFANSQASRGIEPLVKEARVVCSVLTRNRSAYRCFFADGLFVTAIQIGNQPLTWMAGDYGRSIQVTGSGEIAGAWRVFAGDSEGWVYELDVGRSFDGEVIDAGMRLSNAPYAGPLTLAQYRMLELQSEASSAFALALGAEFFDSNVDEVGATIITPTDYVRQYGVGLFWDYNAWDRAYWDGAAANRVVYDVIGQGRSLGILLSSTSDRELPHIVRALITTFTPRRLSR